jgi:hypothetical protein
MQIDVKARDENGEVLLEGKLNRQEVGFLLGYAINDLMHSGVVFNLQKQENGDDYDAPSRIEIPKGTMN